jgi:hypothetical protein
VFKATPLVSKKHATSIFRIEEYIKQETGMKQAAN